MSLLYECINGIIQGGILGDGEDFSAREEVASLCVSKLRGMVSINSDPNRESSGPDFDRLSQMLTCMQSNMWRS